MIIRLFIFLAVLSVAAYFILPYFHRSQLKKRLFYSYKTLKDELKNNLTYVEEKIKLLKSEFGVSVQSNMLNQLKNIEQSIEDTYKVDKQRLKYDGEVVVLEFDHKCKQWLEDSNQIKKDVDNIYAQKQLELENQMQNLSGLVINQVQLNQPIKSKTEEMIEKLLQS